MQKCMQNISKQSTTFIDHCRKGESLWLKKVKTTSVIKSPEKKFLTSLKLKFRSLFLKIKKHRQEKRVYLITKKKETKKKEKKRKKKVTSLVSEMQVHLGEPVETQQVRNMDLNWTCLFCSHRNGTVRTFANRPDFWFTFP